MNTQRPYLFALVFFAVILGICFSNTVRAQMPNIKNDTFWNAKDGSPIYSQGGGIFRLWIRLARLKSIFGMV